MEEGDWGGPQNWWPRSVGSSFVLLNFSFFAKMLLRSGGENNVKQNAPDRIFACCPSVQLSALTQHLLPVWSWLGSATLARPKSHILRSQLALMRRLEGFRSLWSTLKEWMYFSPRRIWRKLNVERSPTSQISAISQLSWFGAVLCCVATELGTFDIF